MSSLTRTCSVFVERNEVFDLFDCHGLGNELDLDFTTFLEHSLGAGGGTGVNFDSDVRGLFQLAVDRRHEPAQQEGWVVQVNKDETVRRVFADGTSDRVNGGFLQEGLIALEAEALLEQRHQVRATDEEALGEIADGPRGLLDDIMVDLLLLIDDSKIVVHLVVGN